MNRTFHTRRNSATRAGGAVIIVVLALMAMLAFLGLFFYDFVQVEANTAENFSRTENPLGGIDPESIIAEAISQVIICPDDEATKRGSVLHADPAGALNGGTKLSLLAHELGTIKKETSTGNFKPVDYELRNGRGIRVTPSATPQFLYTGSDAAPNPGVGTPVPFPLTVFSSTLILNRSAGANGGTTALVDTATNTYEPDVDYTYPDINAFFLAQDYLQLEGDYNSNGTVDPGEDLNGDGDSGDIVRIIKPSFMDPSLFRTLNSDTTKWYTDPTTKQWMLRPHTSHLIPETSTARFSATDFPKLDASALKLGPWTNSGADYTGLDADADNDGIFDSIYIDLGLAPVELSGNRKLQPMAFFKIEDLNGLIDLNTAGNMAEFFRANAAGPVNLVPGVLNYQVAGVNRPVHYSNQGLSRSEVNPMWALFADPTTSGINEFPWTSAFYRTNSVSFNRLQMQNTELAMLLIGSPTTMGQSIGPSFDFTNKLDDIEGRFGDGNRTPDQFPTAPSGQFAAPGNLAVNDDDEDTNGNGILDSGEDTIVVNGVLDGPKNLPRGVHPTDRAGTGSIPINMTASAAIPPIPKGARVLQPINAQGIPFPRYTGNWQSQYVVGGTYQALVGPTSAVEGLADFRTDDPAELNRYSYTNSDRDNPFRPYEIAALHLSDYDYSRSGLFSRTRQLAPFNFNMHQYARDTRRQFTTESWARREFAFPYDPLRNFEFNDPCSIDAGMVRFPPKFNSVNASRHEPSLEDQNFNGNLDIPPAVAMSEDLNSDGLLTPALVSNLDPFRPEVRRLLTTRSLRSGTAPVRNRIYFPQLPLELNRILDDHPSTNTAQHSPAFDRLGNPNFRELTPHPSFRGLATPVATLDDMVHGNDLSGYSSPHPVTQYAARFSTPALQEWWARYDRQRLARDIYVLLVTLCSPGIDPTSTPLDPDTAKEMAQFAVNYVDAFDPDDMITRFEYDIDLSNGWETTQTNFVNGVEAQKLSIGEVLWIKQKKASGDVAATLHKDDTGHHQFLYIELRNSTPFPIDLHPETWRIARIDPTLITPTMDPTLPANHLASFAFKSNVKTVAAGANFVIASHDGNVGKAQAMPMTGTDPLSSDFYADTNSDTTNLEAIVPGNASAVASSGGALPTPQCDLDLCHTDDDNEFTMTPIVPPMRTMSNANPKMLYFDDTNEETDATADRMVLSLQRRRHLYTDGNLPMQPSDWIEVDRFDFTVSSGNKLEINSDADTLTELPQVRSTERYHPLDDRQQLAVLPPAMSPRAFLANHSLYRPYAVNATRATRLNTIADPSDNLTLDMSSAYSTVWQPHHDRDFTSIYELMTVPLFGPDQVLARLRDHNTSDHDVDDVSLVNGWADSTTGTRLPSMAVRRFIPEITNPPPTLDPIPWTRLLNFLSLPDPTDQTQKTNNPNFVRSRTLGQVNINTIRTPPVLAGLLDDDKNKPNGLIDSNSDFLTDQIDGSRQWWTWFKYERDGAPSSAGNSLGSRPFLPPGRYHESLTADDPAAVGVEHGLLRHQYSAYPPTAATTATISIFEARAAGDIATDGVDVHTRYRLLQKLANNTTTRSQCYVVWGGIDFFETTEPTPGKFQVGAKAADVQTCRWFFVIDMTRLEEAYDSKTNTFDWRKFVVYRQRLE